VISCADGSFITLAPDCYEVVKQAEAAVEAEIQAQASTQFDAMEAGASEPPETNARANSPGYYLYFHSLCFISSLFLTT
jgi:hypothetical protein